MRGGNTTEEEVAEDEDVDGDDLGKGQMASEGGELGVCVKQVSELQTHPNLHSPV